MQVSKWGNSLAIRLPAAVVEALQLHEGDDVEVVVAGERVFGIQKKRTAKEWLERLRPYRGKMPADFIFSRDESNDRG